MTCLEHYFENLLHHNQDIKGDPNKNALSPEEQNAVEICAQYVIWTLFDGRENFEEYLEMKGAYHNLS